MTSMFLFQLTFFFYFKFSLTVVTGATEGIGKAYATHLAKKGINVVLVSRSKAKLDAVSQHICKLLQIIKIYD